MEKKSENSGPGNPETIDFSVLKIKAKGLALYLYRKRLWIVVIPVLTAIAGVLYSLSSKRLYTAEYTFVIENGGSSATGYSSIAQQFGISLGGDGTGGIFNEDNIIDLLKSRTIISKSLLTKTSTPGGTIIEDYIEAYHLRDNWKSEPALMQYRFTHDSTGNMLVRNTLIMSIYSEVVSKNINLEKQKKSSIFSLKVSTVNEQLSKEFADALITNVSAFYLQSKVGKQRRNIVALQRKTDSIKKSLGMAMRNAAVSEDISSNVMMQEGKVTARQQSLNVSLLQTSYSELVRNLEAQKISLLNDTPLFQIIDQPILPLSVSFLSWIKGAIFGYLLGMVLIVTILLSAKFLIEIFT